MVKRNLRNIKRRKTLRGSVSSIPNPVKKGKIKKNYKFVTKLAKRQAVYSSSSISLRIRNRRNAPFKRRTRHGGTKIRKQYKTKQKGRCGSNLSVQKRRTYLLKTFFKNLNFTGSCESVEQLNCKKSKSTHQHSFMYITECKHSQKCHDLSELDGFKLKSNLTDKSKSTTEITFKSALLMHVKKTPAKTDVRSESQSEETPMDESQICDFLNEVTAGHMGPYKRSSCNLLKLALHNDRSKSVSSFLRVKSSHNITDLNSQMKIPQPVPFAGPCFHSETMQHCVTDSLSVEQRAHASCCGDENSVHPMMSNSQYTNNDLSTVPFSRSRISQLHHLQGFRSSTLFHSQNTSAQLAPSNNIIITRAMVHREADL